MGYGTIVELSPPQVSLAEKGKYFPKPPPIALQMVLIELENAGLAHDQPQQQLNSRLLWNKVARATYDQPWHALTPAQQDNIKGQINAITTTAGWEELNGYYIKPLPPDVAEAEAYIQKYLISLRGAPIRVDAVHWQAVTGAYGRCFYKADLCPELATLLTEQLQNFGYAVILKDGYYNPKPVQFPPNAVNDLSILLKHLPTQNTDRGQVMLVDNLREALQTKFQLPALTDWQLQGLLSAGILHDTLLELGWQNQTTTLPSDAFLPPKKTDQSVMVICRQIRIHQELEKRVSLADGFSVHAPTLLLDPDEETIVYLEMVGSKQAVRANWAALAAKKMKWIDGKKIQLDGMKEHIRLATHLPCGWYQLVLLHKQASLQEASPETHFYLLDDGKADTPPLFYALLNMALAIPILPAWSDYLWQTGKKTDLVELLNDGIGQGVAGWRVMPAPTDWGVIIQAGLKNQAIFF